MIKKSSQSQPSTPTGGFKENAGINAKIDDYIHNNPKHWEYIQSMPPDRMARALVLNEVQKAERREKMKVGILAKLDQNPEMKEHIEGVVKNLPEDQREKATISIATQAMRAERQSQQQSSGMKV